MRTNKIIEHNVIGDEILKRFMALDDALLTDLDKLEELGNYIPQVEDERIPTHEIRKRIYYIITGGDLREERQQMKKLEGFTKLLKDERLNQKRVDDRDYRDDRQFRESDMKRVNWATDERDTRKYGDANESANYARGAREEVNRAGGDRDMPRSLYADSQNRYQDRSGPENQRTSGAPNVSNYYQDERGPYQERNIGREDLSRAGGDRDMPRSLYVDSQNRYQDRSGPENQRTSGAPNVSNYYQDERGPYQEKNFGREELNRAGGDRDVPRSLYADAQNRYQDRSGPENHRTGGAPSVSNYYQDERGPYQEKNITREEWGFKKGDDPKKKERMITIGEGPWVERKIRE